MAGWCARRREGAHDPHKPHSMPPRCPAPGGPLLAPAMRSLRRPGEDRVRGRILRVLRPGSIPGVAVTRERDILAVDRLIDDLKELRKMGPDELAYYCGKRSNNHEKGQK